VTGDMTDPGPLDAQRSRETPGMPAASTAEPALLSAAEVAAMFGRTPRTLFNWERAGVLMPLRIRRRRYYSVAQIEALLAPTNTRQDNPIPTVVCQL